MILKTRFVQQEPKCSVDFHRGITPPVPFEKIAGFQIAIDTETLHSLDEDGCNGRKWFLIPESVEALRQHTGYPYYSDQTFVCEHIIEIGD
jgi:hypothetical protein